MRRRRSPTASQKAYLKIEGGAASSTAGSTPRSTRSRRPTSGTQAGRRATGFPKRAVRRRPAGELTLDLLFDASDRRARATCAAITDALFKLMEVNQALRRGQEQRPAAERRVRLGRDVDVQGRRRQPEHPVHALRPERHADAREGQDRADAGREGGRAAGGGKPRGQNPTTRGIAGLRDARRARRRHPAVDRLRRATATRRAGARSPRPTASTTRCACAAARRSRSRRLEDVSPGRRRASPASRSGSAARRSTRRSQRAARGARRGQPACCPTRSRCGWPTRGLEHIDTSPLEIGAEVEIRLAGARRRAR